MKPLGRIDTDMNLNIKPNEILGPIVLKLPNSSEASDYSSINLTKVKYEKFKSQLNKISSEIIPLECEMSSIENDTLCKANEFQSKRDYLENESKKLNSNVKGQNMNYVKDKKNKLEKLHELMSELNNEECGALNDLNERQKQLNNKTKAIIETLKSFKNCIEQDHFDLIDKFELIKSKISEVAKRDKIEKQIEEINECFTDQQKHINKLENKLETILFNTQAHFSTKSSTSSLRNSGPNYSVELKRNVIDNQAEYIKKSFGNVLVHGLAKVTMLQPSDPIYYLSNYLLHYHQNEIDSQQNQKDFEELMSKRNNDEHEMGSLMRKRIADDE